MKETLDEYVLRESRGLLDISLRTACKHFMRVGAQWQAEQMYTEEDLREAYNHSANSINPNGKTFENWLKYVKKR
jgi:hypothetical protein